MSMTVFELMATLGLNSMAYEQGLEHAEKAASAAQGTIGGAVSKVADITKTAMVAGGAAITGFGVSAVKTGMNFETSMSQVVATMGYSVDELNTAGSEASETYEQLSKFAQEMGATTAFSASESADALNFMALAGYDAATSMEMLPNVLNLAAAGGMGLADASDMVTDAQSALGLTLEETTQLVDKMAAASSKSNTSVSQLGSAILTVGGTAQNLAGGTTELAQSLGLLADNGIKGAEGGTALRNIILSLTAPTDKAAAAMESLGLQISDETGKMRPLQDIFTDFNAVLGDMSDTEKTQVLNEIFNKVDLKSVSALMGTTTERWEQLAVAIDDSAGAAENMANVQLDNLSGDITLLQSAWEGFQIAIVDSAKGMDALRPAVQFLSDSLSRTTTALQEGGLIGGLKELGNIGQESFSKLAEGARNAFESIKGNAPQIMETAKGIFAGFSEAMAGLRANLSDYVGIGVDIVSNIIDGMSGFVTSFMANWAQNWDAILTAIGENIDGILEVGGKIINAVMNGIETAAPMIKDTIVGLLEKAGPWIETNLPVLVDSVVAVIQRLGEIITSNMGPILNAGISFIQAVVNGIANSADSLLGAGGDILNTLVTGIENAMPVIVGGIADIVGRIGGWISENLGSIASAGMEILSRLVAVVRENAGTLIDAGINLIQNLAQGLVEAIPEIVKWIPNIIENLVMMIAENAPKIIKGGVQLAVTLAEGLYSAIPTIIETIPKIVNSIVEAIKSVDWLQLGKDVVVTIGKGLLAIASHIPDILKAIAKAAYQVIFGVDWLGLGGSIIKGILGGIVSLVKAIPHALLSIGEHAVEGFMSIDWMKLGRDILTFIGKGIAALFTAIPNKLKSIGESAVAKFEEIDWEGVGQKIMNALEWGIDKVKSIPGKIKGLGEKAVGLFTGIDWNNAGQEATERIVEGAEVAGPKLANSIKGAGEEASGLFENLGWGNVGQEATEEIAVGAEVAGPGIIDNIKSAGENAVGLFESLGWSGAGQGATESIAAGAEVAGPGIIDNIQSAGENAKELFEDIDWKESGEAAVNLQRDGLEYLKDKVPDKMREIGKSAVDRFKSLGPEFQKSGSDTINKVVSGFQSLAPSIPNVLTNIGQNAADKFRNINWYSLGVNIVQGIINGVSRNVGALVQTIRNMADNALGSAMSFLGINSPSKKFRDKVGKPIAEGIIVGFTKNFDSEQLEESLRVTLDDITNSLRKSTIQWDKYTNLAWMRDGTNPGIRGLAEEIEYNLSQIGSSTEETMKYLMSEYDMEMDDAKTAIREVERLYDDAERYSSVLTNVGIAASKIFSELGKKSARTGANMILEFVKGTQNLSIGIQTKIAKTSKSLKATLSDVTKTLKNSSVQWEKYINLAWMRNGKNSGILGLAEEIEWNLKKIGSSIKDTVDYLVSEYDMSFDDALEAIDAVNELYSAAEQKSPDMFEVDAVRLGEEEKKNGNEGDTIIFNVYPRAEQDEKKIAEETMKLFTLWERQRRRVYA